MLFMMPIKSYSNKIRFTPDDPIYGETDCGMLKVLILNVLILW